MKTISLKIKPSDVSKFGLDEISSMKFDELVEKIRMDFVKEALSNAQAIASKTGLSDLSSSDIDAEIKALRNESQT